MARAAAEAGLPVAVRLAAGERSSRRCCAWRRARARQLNPSATLSPSPTPDPRRPSPSS